MEPEEPQPDSRPSLSLAQILAVLIATSVVFGILLQMDHGESVKEIAAKGADLYSISLQGIFFLMCFPIGFYLCLLVQRWIGPYPVSNSSRTYLVACATTYTLVCMFVDWPYDEWMTPYFFQMLFSLPFLVSVGLLIRDRKTWIPLRVILVIHGLSLATLCWIQELWY